ncbi:MAG: hypothetical protein JRM77_04760 [Nitrososphaerota archaeon]|nr:hypothetical protein [Nitrososphaerota archaeon]
MDSKDRLELIRFGAVLLVLALALIIDAMVSPVLTPMLGAFWAPLVSFLGAALIGYFLLFVFPHSYTRK